MTTILVVGQTPPPFHGQAIMIEAMLSHAFRNTRLIPVRMNFSKEIDDIGRVRIGKLFTLVAILFKILVGRLRGADVLYYPPSGPHLVPVIRDMLLLIPTRWMFRATIFHFHAAGLSEIYDRLPRTLQHLFWLAYDRPTVVIRMSPSQPEDGKFLHAEKEFIVPYGIEDLAAPYLAQKEAIKW